ncbi:MAG: tryptophan-rich sensory protein [Acidobacteria bacterium]|nr:tryptophan-rich sensory protein [Acidobacteriota bacterium]
MATRSTSRTNLLALASFLCFSFAAACLAAQFPPGEWYAGPQKPSWSPPNWLFGPLWTLFYATMAFAAWRAWLSSRLTKGTMLIFSIQLVLSALWSWVCFGLRLPGLALVEISVLLLGAAVTTRRFGRADRLAGLLMLPYLAWIAFAAALNLELWRTN